MLRQVCEKMRKRTSVFVAFMDLETAYDRVDREVMRQVLRVYDQGGRVLWGMSVSMMTVEHV